MPINDTMIRYTPSTGYPVLPVGRRRRITSARPLHQPVPLRVMRWTMLMVSAALGITAVLWVAVGVASNIPAIQSRMQSQAATADLQDRWQTLTSGSAAVPYGEAWATVSIPAIGLADMVVFEGTDAQQINVGVGHYVGTAMPADGSGNVGLAGHRTGWGEPFKQLDELQAGDEIVVRTGDRTYTYTVTGSTVVRPDEVWVLDAAPDFPTGASGDAQLLTLTTCEGAANEERLVVWAELTGSARVSA